MPDLVTQPVVLARLADLNLSSAQATLVPALTAAASRAIRAWCNRYFNRRTIDELYTPEPRQPLLLREFPVNSVARVATDPTSVLLIQNTASTTTRATVALTTTGDTDAGLVVTGLSLTRVAVGASFTQPVTFSAGQTIASVAAAVNALSNGWTAAAGSYSAWPAADLRAPQGALPAYGQAAAIYLHVTDLPFDLDAATGTLYFGQAAWRDDAWTSPRWGPTATTEFGDQLIRGLPLGLRVVYDAGFDTVPEDVQQACCLTVADMLRALAVNPRLSSESIGDYSYVLNSAFADYGLPKTVIGLLAPYRNTRS